MPLDDTPDELNGLVGQFRALAIGKAAASSRGDYASVNRIVDEIGVIFRTILTFGNAGRAALIALVDDVDNHVALLASVYSLRHNPERCKYILTRLSGEAGMLGFSARQSIVNWETGKWALEDDISTITEGGDSDLVSTGVANDGATAEELIDELAQRDDGLGEIFRGIKERSSMTDEEIIKAMISRDDVH